jgi:hypothetical protein
MAASKPKFADSVFINCPFDDDYWPIFEAIVFCVLDAGFTPRCALEEADSGQVRLDKICRIIRSTQYGIHDLSRTEPSPTTALPRFNMPFELGLDLGCRTYGSAPLKRKKLLVLDAEPYRYQAFISDIAGQDIRPHRNSPDEAITVVRHWLRTASGRTTVPGASAIKRRFIAFTSALPDLCERSGVDPDDLQFVEYAKLAELWLSTP